MAMFPDIDEYSFMRGCNYHFFTKSPARLDSEYQASNS